MVQLCTTFTRPSSQAYMHVCVYHTEGLGTKLSSILAILTIDIAVIFLLYVRTQGLFNLRTFVA